MSVPDAALDQYWELLLGEPLDAARHPMRGEARAGPADLRSLRRRRERGGGGGALQPGPPATGGSPTTSPVHELDGAEVVHLPVLLRDGFGISGSEARRLIDQGAVRIDGEPRRGRALDVPAAELRGRVLQVGKRRFLRLQAG